MRRACVLAQVPHHMEQGEERDGEGGQEETEAQRQGHNAHRDQDSTERLLLQFLFPTSRYVLGLLFGGFGRGESRLLSFFAFYFLPVQTGALVFGRSLDLDSLSCLGAYVFLSTSVFLL